MIDDPAEALTRRLGELSDRLDAIEVLDVGAQFVRHRNVAATPYAVVDGDLYLDVDTSVLAITINLPSAARGGRVLVIKDEAGAAAAQNITITPAGIETIDGAAGATIAANFGVLRIYADGTNWLEW